VSLETLKAEYRKQAETWPRGWAREMKPLFESHEKKLIAERERKEADDYFPGDRPMTQHPLMAG